jgi:hypothetical protein
VGFIGRFGQAFLAFFWNIRKLSPWKEGAGFDAFDKPFCTGDFHVFHVFEFAYFGRG